MAKNNFMEMTTFEKWSKERNNYYKNYETAKTKLLKQIDKISSNKVKGLEDILNQVVKD